MPVDEGADGIALRRREGRCVDPVGGCIIILGNQILISVSQLDYAGYEIKLSGGRRRITDWMGKRSQIHLLKNMYYVDLEFYEPLTEQYVEDPNDPASSNSCSSCFLSQAERLKMHERCGHYWTSENRIKHCPACDLAKAGREGHAKVRPEYLIPQEFLEQVDWDFTDPYPESFTGSTWLLSAM